MSFDPTNALNRHIALLTLLREAEREVGARKGILLMSAKVTGRLIASKLRQSKSAMQANKMWVNEIPVADRRYGYTLSGRRDVYEISEEDLALHIGMVMVELERELGQVAGGSR
jgi:hypothetical protein